MRHRLCWGGIGLLLIANADPASVPTPSFAAGDQWVFDQTLQVGTSGFDQRRLDLVVERVDGATMLVGIKRDGAPTAYQDQVVGTDWSHRQLVNGQETPTARPLAFPLTPGKTWTVDYTDPTRRGTQTSVHVHRIYKVAGWEDVTVPAGVFHAVKIEAAGADDAVFVVPSAVVGGAANSPLGGATMTQSRPGGTVPKTVRSLDALYYAPAIKNYVKTVEEQYNANDVLVRRQTRTLVSYHAGA